MSRPLPKRSVLSAGFWLRYLLYVIASLAVCVALGLAVGHFWPGIGGTMIACAGSVAILGSWVEARSLPAAEIERWKRDNPEPPPVPLFYFRESGYIYGPHTLEELRARFPASAGVEIAEYRGQTERELKKGSWQDLREVSAGVTS